MVKFTFCCFEFDIQLRKRKKPSTRPENVQTQAKPPPEIIVNEPSEVLSTCPSLQINKFYLNVQRSFSKDSGLHTPATFPSSEAISPSMLSSDMDATGTPLLYSAEWVQVSGHKGNFFKPLHDKEGVVLKGYSEIELNCYSEIKNEPNLYNFVPKFTGLVSQNQMKFLQLEDLLAHYSSPSVMDCKIGCRTYLQEDLDIGQNKYRTDLYEKMVAISPNEPTPDEHERRGILKSRYMIFRESLSSTATLSFRVEGTKHHGSSKKMFPHAKTFEQVVDIFADFTGSNGPLIEGYIKEITLLRETLLGSDFFANHEIIGSSLLFVHGSDWTDPIVKMIDFARIQLSIEGPLKHSVLWEKGNQEDGYLLGIDSIISVLRSLSPDVR